MPQTERAKKLWSMVDPYVYRSHLSLPKLIVLGSNDPYWSTDALNLYWDSLPGKKWVLYVPNAGHDLRERQVEPTLAFRRALHTTAAFLRHHVHDNPLPAISWKHTSDRTNASLELHWQVPANPHTRLTAARLWFADAPTRDFRQAVWKSQDLPLNAANHQTRGSLSIPEKGCRALFGELEFEEKGQTYWLSTQMEIVGTPSRP